ncbi:MAG TPA: FAD-dependent oxidoreductase [archaeon]|nr:FAD-dependent oxidoreductase [archaeon]
MNFLHILCLFLNKNLFTGNHAIFLADELFFNRNKPKLFYTVLTFFNGVSMQKIDLAIIGSGPAGISAAIYGLRRNLHLRVFESEAAGGQTAKAIYVENYPGFQKLTGLELMQKMSEHLKSLGAEIEEGNGVKSVKKNKTGEFELELESGEKILARAVLLATGTENKSLNVPMEKELYGKGVSYCANCDGPFFRGKKVAVIGGGNSGVTNALYMAEMASKAWLIEYSQELSCEEVYFPILKKQKNLEVMLNSQLVEILGKEKVSGIKIKNGKTGKEKTIELEGVFIYVGLTPRNTLAKQLGAETDSKGFVKINSMMMTSIEGFFAAGDITGGLAQTVWAAAEGTKAVLAVHAYLKGIQRKSLEKQSF